MTVMQEVTYLGLLLAAVAVHGLILRFAVSLMVEVRMQMRAACEIIAAEYLAAAAITGVLVVVATPAWQVPAVLAFIGLITTGAVMIGRRVALPGGEPVGLGNGILIQFMQIPMIITPAILLSFLFIPPG